MEAQVFASQLAQQGLSFLEALPKNELPLWLKDHDLRAANSEGQVFVLLMETKWVMAIWFRVTPDFAEIDYITTLPTFRNKGWAQTGLLKFKAYLLSVNVSQVWLEVSQQNSSAIALYERTGFTRQSERQNYYGPGKSAINYVWSLSKA